MNKVNALHLLITSAVIVSQISLAHVSAANESNATSSTTANSVITTTTTTTTSSSTLNNSQTSSSTTTAATMVPTTTPKPNSTPSTTTTTNVRCCLEGGHKQVEEMDIVDGSVSVEDLVRQKITDEDMKKIKLRVDPKLRPTNRIIVNKPTLAPQMVDFASNSLEAKISDATTQFGLNYLNKLPGGTEANVVLSPLSLQNLLNMILLGSKDDSGTQKELAKVLGYETTNLLTSGTSDRLKPHEAMRSVFQNILAATHLSVSSPVDETDLLNANLNSLTPNEQASKNTDSVSAVLQTSNREGDDPLTGQVNFTLANLVLTNDDLVDLKPDYEKDLKNYYNVNIEHFSKSSSKQGAASKVDPLHERVNKWVRNMTQNQIEKLVEEGDLSGDDLIMVLLNAAHFKGRWLHTFNAKATSDRLFLNNGSEKDKSVVKFMRQKESFAYADFSTKQFEQSNNYMGSGVVSATDADTLISQDAPVKPKVTADASDKGSVKAPSNTTSFPQLELSKEETRRIELSNKLNCTVLMMPFSLNEGQELSMVILLPIKNDGIGELQKALDAPTLNEIYKSLGHQEVRVEIPKFSFEVSHDAKSTLAKMGLGSALNTPNLDRMMISKSASKGLKVDKIIHKAKINVDESGAEAAAASMASIALRNFIRQPSPLFIADHPFLFIIRHSRSNMPLFMGRVSRF